MQAVEDFLNLVVHWLTDLRLRPIAYLTRPAGVGVALAGIGAMGFGMVWPATLTFLIGMTLYAIGPRWCLAIVDDAAWQMEQVCNDDPAFPMSVEEFTRRCEASTREPDADEF